MIEKVGEFLSIRSHYNIGNLRLCLYTIVVATTHFLDFRAEQAEPLPQKSVEIRRRRLMQSLSTAYRNVISGTLINKFTFDSINASLLPALVVC